MPDNMIGGSVSFDAAATAAAVAGMDLRDRSATVIGYGYMGKEYVAALQALRTGRIRVASRSPEPLEELPGIETRSGGYAAVDWEPVEGEVAIIAVPPPELIPASEHLIKLGYKRLLVEKPVSFWSQEIKEFTERAAGCGVEIRCAYNRVHYPAFYELLARSVAEGGITSCAYDFTELIRSHWPERFSAQELARWGVANSLHVLSMAHGLIGLPDSWQGYRADTGSVTWHSAGTTFTGAGVSVLGVPFSYHANWGSKNRWALEVSTKEAAYRLCPMETLQRRDDPLGDWEDVALAVAYPQVKMGIAELVAACFGDRSLAPVIWEGPSCLQLTRFGEEVFGYPSDKPAESPLR
jgi:predicted dehydrogenase